MTAAANRLADELDARVFLYSGGIDARGYGKLIEEMQPTDERPHRPNSVLILTTQGGIADWAYKIARLFQETSDQFHLIVPAACKSAGTLIALGATDLYMNVAVSELGPLDVQLLQRDEIGQRRSGLVVRTAFDGLAEETFSIFQRVMLGIKSGSQQTVSFEVASRIAASITTGVMAPVYAQINPDALGNDLRDLNVATEYGDRLAKRGGNAMPSAVNALVAGYPAHEFIIDRAEASTLFKRVADLPETASAVVKELGGDVYVEQSPHVIRRLDQHEKEAGDGDDTAGDQPEPAEGGSRVAPRRKTARNGDREGERAPGADEGPHEAA